MVLNKKIVLKTFYNYNTIKQTLTREREYGFNTKQNYGIPKTKTPSFFNKMTRMTLERIKNTK